MPLDRRERLEAACGRALEIGARSYTSVTRSSRTTLIADGPPWPRTGPAIPHPDIRAPSYFH